MDLPKTMKAWVVSRNGLPATALTLQTAWPSPSASPPTGANILVKISHAALNPADLQFMALIPTWLPFRRSPIPGLDFTGEVVAAGPAASLAGVGPEDESGSAAGGVQVGTQVCGALGFGQVPFGKGALAEYVVVPSQLVAVKPKDLDAGVAAGLCGVAGQTTAMVLQAASVKGGEKVLVNGASGGVGTVLVQVLKGMGCRVVAVCSLGNEPLVRGLGAEEFIDYKTDGTTTLYTRLADAYGKEDDQLDVIFDCVGDGVLFEKSVAYMKPSGRLVNIVGGSTLGIVPFVKYRLLPTFLGGVPRSYQILELAPSGQGAREAASWVEKGWVKDVPVDCELGMADAVKGYERQMSKRAKGKIIIKVQE